MALSWTTIISSIITASINGATMFLTVRYLGKMIEHIEKKTTANNKDAKDEVLDSENSGDW